MAKINSWRIGRISQCAPMWTNLDSSTMSQPRDRFGCVPTRPLSRLCRWMLLPRPESQACNLSARGGHCPEVRHSDRRKEFSPAYRDRTTRVGLDYEALWQFGSFGSKNIRAWTMASENGYRLTSVALKPRFSAKVDVSSGDHPKSNPSTTRNIQSTISRKGTTSAY